VLLEYESSPVSSTISLLRRPNSPKNADRESPIAEYRCHPRRRIDVRVQESNERPRQIRSDISRTCTSAVNARVVFRTPLFEPQSSILCVSRRLERGKMYTDVECGCWISQPEARDQDGSVHASRASRKQLRVHSEFLLEIHSPRIGLARSMFHLLFL